MHYLNLQGYKCPQPILKTKKFLTNLRAGEQVEITTDDPDSANDLICFCQKTGNLIINQAITQQIIKTIIQRKGN